MKRFLLVVFLIVGAWYIWYQLNARQKPNDQQPIHFVETNSIPLKASTEPPTPALRAKALAQNTNDAYVLSLSELDFYKLGRIDRKLEWKMPINFWGKVVDESNNPVANAGVHFVWNDTSPNGTSEANILSDASGLFSLGNRRGKGLSVSVGKDGYYTPKSERISSFEYAQPEIRFHPDKNNPVVFHLQTKGVCDPLIFIQKNFLVSRDGKPVEVDLKTGQKSHAMDNVKIECVVNDSKKDQFSRFDWSCKVSTPNGGIIETTNEFPFVAPVEGYQRSDLIEMPASLGQTWKSDVAKKYFLKFNDGNYACIVFRMIAGGDNFFKLESFLNPGGSRNLEYDSAKQLNASQ